MNEKYRGYELSLFILILYTTPFFIYYYLQISRSFSLFLSTNHKKCCQIYYLLQIVIRVNAVL